MEIGKGRRQGGGESGRYSPEQKLLFFHREAEEHVGGNVEVEPLKQCNGPVNLTPGESMARNLSAGGGFTYKLTDYYHAGVRSTANSTAL